ncbi:MAG: M28 family metallopeptidase [Candidatus Helarchaeota archaeon]
MAPKDKFSMTDFITEVCEEIGPRLGTYSQEKETGLKIKQILETQVDEVILEDFTCHPAAFLDFTKVAWIMVISGTILYWWLPIVSFILFTYALTIYVFEQMFLREWVDFLFPKRIGINVIGKLKPLKKTKQIVICSGHHDSAYEFPLFKKYGAKFGIIAYFTAATIILSMLAALGKFILDLFTFSSSISDSLLLIIPILCCVMTGYLNFGLHSNLVIPGAQDNLSGVSIVLALAHHFAQHKLNNIELWLISFSCEECMRGSKRFVAKHKEELINSKTINFDMVAKGEISIISREPYFTAKHSMELAKEFQQSTPYLPIRVVHFGGSDAANFSKKGLQAINIMGLTPEGYPDTWHVMEDTPAVIEPEKLKRTLEATIQYLVDLDDRSNKNRIFIK